MKKEISISSRYPDWIQIELEMTDDFKCGPFSHKYPLRTWCIVNDDEKMNTAFVCGVGVGRETIINNEIIIFIHSNCHTPNPKDLIHPFPPSFVSFSLAIVPKADSPFVYTLSEWNDKCAKEILINVSFPLPPRPDGYTQVSPPFFLCFPNSKYDPYVCTVGIHFDHTTRIFRIRSLPRQFASQKTQDLMKKRIYTEI